MQLLPVEDLLQVSPAAMCLARAQKSSCLDSDHPLLDARRLTNMWGRAVEKIERLPAANSGRSVDKQKLPQ